MWDLSRSVADIEQERTERLRDVLRDYNHADVIAALGAGDLLEAISAHEIMDYICYVVMKRTDMREPWTPRQIFKREVLSLAERIKAQDRASR
jgi:hypothetical protein